jgi:NADH:ubiquinone oxidoreductase subunit H
MVSTRGSGSSSSSSRVQHLARPHARHAVPRRLAIPASGGFADLLGPFVLFVKLMAVAFLMFWVRFTYPRLREDQLQAVAWKFLIPLALLNIVVTGIFKVAV